MTLGVVEIGLRHVLFNGDPVWDFLRKPGNYALYHKDGNEDHFNEDYWKLQYLFNRAFNVTKPHPLLGWSGNFSKKDYEHADEARAKGRRPVLLYGDSFAMCVDSVECFEDHLNADSTFSAEHYFMNFGVGGYGVDQIHILMEETIELHEKPFVIFSMLTTDMDRSMLYMRDSNKGRFKLEDDELVLTHTPITLSTEEFVAANPPEIWSYSVNLILNGLMKVFGEPGRFKWEYVAELKSVNEALIRKSIEQLRASNTEFVVLLFQSSYHAPHEWRNVFLRDLFAELEVPYLASSDIIDQVNETEPRDISAYTIVGDGHPTSLANQLVSDVLLEYILHPESRASLECGKNWPID